ncbi:MAG: hypothetical protein WC745_02650 [Patescibacteria group bacterium]
MLNKKSTFFGWLSFRLHPVNYEKTATRLKGNKSSKLNSLTVNFINILNI